MFANCSSSAGQKFPGSEHSTRVVLSFVLVGFVILTATYSSQLVATFAVKPFKLPFTDLRGLVDSAQYQMLVRQDTSHTTLLEVYTGGVRDISIRNCFLWTLTSDLHHHWTQDCEIACSVSRIFYKTAKPGYRLLTQSSGEGTIYQELWQKTIRDQSYIDDSWRGVDLVYEYPEKYTLIDDKTSLEASIRWAGGNLRLQT